MANYCVIVIYMFYIYYLYSVKFVAFLIHTVLSGEYVTVTAIIASLFALIGSCFCDFPLICFSFNTILKSQYPLCADALRFITAFWLLFQYCMKGITWNAFAIVRFKD